MGDVGVVDVSKVGVVALLSNSLKHLHHLVLADESIECELLKLFREIVRWDIDQTIVGLLFGGRFWRQTQTARN